MTRYCALLRAVNVGGTGKLPMTELRAMCEGCGFKDVRTYIASGGAFDGVPLWKPARKGLPHREPLAICGFIADTLMRGLACCPIPDRGRSRLSRWLGSRCERICSKLI